MARVTLVVGRDPERLLRAAADRFLSSPPAVRDDPFQTPDYLLALRQGGLRDDLIRLAAEGGVRGWFDPGLCLFHDLPDRLGRTPRAPCTDFARAALLARVVRDTGGAVFGRIRRVEDFLPDLERLVGELVAEDVSPDDLAAAMERAGDRDAFARARDGELVAVYRAYRERLDAAGLRDGRDALADTARAVLDDADGVAARLGGRREIRIFGLQDVRGGWRLLLRALAASPAVDRVAVYASEPLDLQAAVAVDTVHVEEPVTAATRLFADEPAGGDEHFDSIEAPTIEREMGEVARRVRALADQGVPLHRIAVIPRQARPYTDLALRALDRFGVPASARRRFAYAEVPVIRALLAVYRAAAGGWSRHELVELADLPHLGMRLDARVLNYVGYRRAVRGLDAWGDALAALEREAREYESDREARWTERPPPSARRIGAARAAFGTFAQRARALEAPRPLREWLQGVRDAVEHDEWGIHRRSYDVPEARFDVAKRDLAAWRGVSQILDEWHEALARWGGGEESLTVQAFHARLQEMLAGDLALWTETPRGVRVVESLAAAYRSFAHVFLVGMEAGAFPLAPPRSPVLDEDERAALVGAGLPLDLRADWEARERRLFRVLVAGAAGRLTVSYTRLSADGRDAIRSSFVEALADAATETPALVDRRAVFTPTMPLFRDVTGAAQAAHGARIERLRESGEPSPYNGGIEDPGLRAWLAREFGDDRLWSPTQLEAYARCPWAYFSSRLLRLEKLADPDDEMEATVRGEILHRALRRFFDRAMARAGGHFFLRESDLGWALPLAADVLDEALASLEGTVWLGAPVFRGAKREELRRILQDYLGWEAEQHEDMFKPRKVNAPRMLRTAVCLNERSFRDAVLERDGIRFRYRGAIDRVEIGIDDRVRDGHEFVAAVDYKTTKAAAPGHGDKEAWDDGVVLQLPLYAHALETIVPGARVARVEYRALTTRELVHPLELHRVDRKAGVRYPHDEDGEKMARALDAVPRHVRRIRGGEFPAQPAPSCLCPPFCHAWDVCRIAGGPRVKPERR
jgi:hypothetical protein